jgi:hypothetical protein
MSKRFSIWVLDSFGEREVEYLQVDANPEGIAEALRKKTMGKGKDRTPKYASVRIQENQP